MPSLGLLELGGNSQAQHKLQKNRSGIGRSKGGEKKLAAGLANLNDE